MLKQAGYRTGLFGKWGLGYTGTTGIPNKKGFDEFFGYHTQLHAHTYYPHHLYDERPRLHHPEQLGHEAAPVRPRPDRRARDEVPRRPTRDQPFFLYLPSTIPHANNELGRDTGDGMEIPDWGEFAKKDWPKPEKGNAAMMTRLDRDVGRVLDKLARPAPNRTRSSSSPATTARTRKAATSRSSSRAAARSAASSATSTRAASASRSSSAGPASSQPGSTSDQPIAFWDMLPTLAEIGGGSAPAKASMASR